MSRSSSKVQASRSSSKELAFPVVDSRDGAPSKRESRRKPSPSLDRGSSPSQSANHSRATSIDIAGDESIVSDQPTASQLLSQDIGSSRKGSPSPLSDLSPRQPKIESRSSSKLRRVGSNNLPSSPDAPAGKPASTKRTSSSRQASKSTVPDGSQGQPSLGNRSSPKAIQIARRISVIPASDPCPDQADQPIYRSRSPSREISDTKLLLDLPLLSISRTSSKDVSDSHQPDLLTSRSRSASRGDNLLPPDFPIFRSRTPSVDLSNIGEDEIFDPDLEFFGEELFGEECPDPERDPDLRFSVSCDPSRRSSSVLEQQEWCASAARQASKDAGSSRKASTSSVPDQLPSTASRSLGRHNPRKVSKGRKESGGASHMLSQAIKKVFDKPDNPRRTSADSFTAAASTKVSRNLGRKASKDKVAAGKKREDNSVQDIWDSLMNGKPLASDSNEVSQPAEGAQPQVPRSLSLSQEPRRPPLSMNPRRASLFGNWSPGATPRDADRSNVQQAGRSEVSPPKRSAVVEASRRRLVYSLARAFLARWDPPPRKDVRERLRRCFKSMVRSERLCLQLFTVWNALQEEVRAAKERSRSKEVEAEAPEEAMKPTVKVHEETSEGVASLTGESDAKSSPRRWKQDSIIADITHAVAKMETVTKDMSEQERPSQAMQALAVELLKNMDSQPFLSGCDPAARSEVVHDILEQVNSNRPTTETGEGAVRQDSAAFGFVGCAMRTSLSSGSGQQGQPEAQKDLQAQAPLRLSGFGSGIVHRFSTGADVISSANGPDQEDESPVIREPQTFAQEEGEGPLGEGRAAGEESREEGGAPVVEGEAAAQESHEERESPVVEGEVAAAQESHEEREAPAVEGEVAAAEESHEERKAPVVGGEVAVAESLDMGQVSLEIGAEPTESSLIMAPEAVLAAACLESKAQERHSIYEAPVFLHGDALASERQDSDCIAENHELGIEKMLPSASSSKCFGTQRAEPHVTPAVATMPAAGAHQQVSTGEHERRTSFASRAGSAGRGGVSHSTSSHENSAPDAAQPSAAALWCGGALPAAPWWCQGSAADNKRLQLKRTIQDVPRTRRRRAMDIEDARSPSPDNPCDSRRVVNGRPCVDLAPSTLYFSGGTARSPSSNLSAAMPRGCIEAVMEERLRMGERREHASRTLEMWKPRLFGLEPRLVAAPCSHEDAAFSSPRTPPLWVSGDSEPRLDASLPLKSHVRFHEPRPTVRRKPGEVHVPRFTAAALPALKAVQLEASTEATLASSRESKHGRLTTRLGHTGWRIAEP